MLPLNLINATGCFCANYGLSRAVFNGGYFAAKYLGLPTNPFAKKSYKTYARNCEILNNKLAATDPDVHGATLVILSISAIAKVLFFNYPLQTILVLKFNATPIAHAIVIALFTGAAKLNSLIYIAQGKTTLDKQPTAMQVFGAALSGAVCSLVQWKMGLIYAIIAAVGHALHYWQHLTNYSLSIIPNKLRAVSIAKICSTAKIYYIAKGILRAYRAPMQLAYCFIVNNRPIFTR